MADLRRQASRKYRPTFELLEPRHMLSLSGSLLEPIVLDPPLGEIVVQPSQSNLSPALQTALEQSLLPKSETEAPQLDESLNLALIEDGFFIVEGHTGQHLFTRDGNFRINDRHEVVTHRGNRVLGFTVDDDWELLPELAPLVIPFGKQSSQVTSFIKIVGALNPSTDIGTGSSTSVVIFDENGNDIPLSITAVLEAKNADSTVFRWTANYGATPNSTETIGTGIIRFDSNGDVVLATNLNLLIKNGSSEIPIQLDFTQVKALGETDAQGTPISSLNVVRKDGFPLGKLLRIIVTGDGNIQGQFDTGLHLIVGQIQLATIANPHGLRRVAKGLYVSTLISGTPRIGEPNSAVFGSILKLPPGYHLSKNGELLRENESPSSKSSITNIPSLSLRYPWLIRSVNLQLNGKELFILEGRNAKQLFTRDGHFHLNAQQQLVNRDGLRVLGTSPSSTQLGPLTIPLGHVEAKATTTANFVGVLNPLIGIGAIPSISESVVLGDGSGVSNLMSDLDGPVATTGTRLVDLIVRQGESYVENFFKAGTLTFTADIDGVELTPNNLTITDDPTTGTTLQELIDFMRDAMGIDTQSDIPGIPFPSTGNVSIVGGRIMVTSNLGKENAIEVSLTAFRLQAAGLTTFQTLPISFSVIQAADGPGITTEMVVFDSLGLPVRVRIVTTLEQRNPDSTVFRWYATSPDNEPLAGVSTVVGNGLLEFNSNGDLTNAIHNKISIQRHMSGSDSLLEVELDFTQVKAKSKTDAQGNLTSYLNVTSQNGLPPGALQKFSISKAGEVIGQFTTGYEKTLGQIQLAKFRRPFWLKHVGQKLLVPTRWSGPPNQVTTPGDPGVGALNQKLPTLPEHHHFHNGDKHQGSKSLFRHLHLKQKMEEHQQGQVSNPLEITWSRFRRVFRR